MQYVLDKSMPTEVRVKIRADAAEVDEAIRDYKENARVLLADKLVAQLLEREKINPVSRPMYEGDELKPGQSYEFTARLAVLPLINLPDYASLEVRLPEPGLEPEELRGVFLSLLRHFADVREVTDGRKATAGDIAVVDIEAAADGVDVPEMHAHDLRVHLDEKGRLKDVSVVVMGLSTGETGNGTIVCPDDFPRESLRGKRISLKITLNKLFSEQLPTLDAEFAKKIGFDTLDALEKKVLSDAMGNKIAAIKTMAGEKLLNDLLDKTDFPLPEPVRALFIRNEFLEARDIMLRAGMQREQITARLQEQRTAMEAQAERHARAHCYLLALAFRENLQVPEKELEKAIAQMAGKNGNPAELRKNMEKNGTLSDVQERLLTVRAMEFLYSHVHKVVVDRNGNPVEAPQKA
ncbi:MAG: trigger factor [Mailhella sp.]|nr:trigger factor [Mailhella sp.]